MGGWAFPLSPFCCSRKINVYPVYKCVFVSYCIGHINAVYRVDISYSLRSFLS